MKKSLLIVLASFYYCSVSAQIKENIILLDSNNVEIKYDFVVRKSFFESYPKAPSSTNDFEKIFTDTEIGLMDSIINAYKRKTGIEITIVSVNKSHVLTEQFDAFANLVCNKWGISTKEKNKGILIMVSKTHRKIRISHSIGLENNFTDMDANAVITNRFIPNFRKAQYAQGTLEGLKEVISIINAKTKRLPKNSIGK
jgi:uncharacterized protein